MRTARTLRRRDGFTLLEVMMGVLVMMIGVMGVMAIQRAVIHANYESRGGAIATTNSARWSAILRRSALTWTDPNDSSASSVPYLKHVGEDWFIPAENPGEGETEPAGLDWYGREASDFAVMRYCTLIRVRSVTDGLSMRADVITFWPRQASSAAGAGFLKFQEICQEGQGASAAAALSADDPTVPVAEAGLHTLRSTMILRRARQ